MQKCPECGTTMAPSPPVFRDQSVSRTRFLIFVTLATLLGIAWIDSYWHVRYLWHGKDKPYIYVIYSDQGMACFLFEEPGGVIFEDLEMKRRRHDLGTEIQVNLEINNKLYVNRGGWYQIYDFPVEFRVQRQFWLYQEQIGRFGSIWQFGKAGFYIFDHKSRSLLPSGATSTSHLFRVGISYGWLLLLLIITALFVERRSLFRRNRLHRCTQCSYDLRAHAPGQKCPECGTPIPEQPIAPKSSNSSHLIALWQRLRRP